MGEISSALFLLQEVRQLSDAPILPLSFPFLLSPRKKAKRKNQRKKRERKTYLYYLSFILSHLIHPIAYENQSSAAVRA